MTLHKYRVDLEIDDIYESPDDFEEEVGKAMENQEAVELHVAGTHFTATIERVVVPEREVSP